MITPKRLLDMVCTEAFEQNKLDAMADAVLAYKPPAKAKATKRREKRRAKRAAKKG